jgi:hypothetical protein
MHGQSWASCAAFEADLAADRIPPDVRAVMYDLEGWEKTPLPERQDPVSFMHRFTMLARERDFFTIITPHQGLVAVPDAPHAPGPGESKEEAYLRSGIAAEAARFADMSETQAQRLQRDPDEYRRFVERAADQARQANPAALFLSGLSTHPGYPATVEMLLASWESVRDVVDGHYLSIRRRGQNPDVAVQFLRLVSKSDPG